MKIHGTAKGGALSKKDFGVAFGGGGGGAAIDDTDLMAYWKFSEEDGQDIINSSQSDESLGSGAAIGMEGGTYEVTGTPTDLGNAVTFDGSDTDYGVCGTSQSQFNFMHNQSGLFTINWWMKYLGTISEEYILDTVFTEGTQVGFYVRTRATDGMQFRIVRGVDNTRVIVLTTTANFIPDKTGWHMYTLKFDYSGSSPQATILRDNSNAETATITSDAASNSNSTYAMQIARAGNDSGFGNFQACEWSIWNRILTDDEITTLYNSGDGQQIY